ncbi:S8 family serine peptidase [uncultured Anaerococcus sp.]|uniref:S8 family serine peptidase n=1 Tax=uncultured Anaerococcus sp. TaxID=293428 RepID=UPI0026034EF5|nr:S8 family serine peptidase [uncultured Anaerococcus sp.]
MRNSKHRFLSLLLSIIMLLSNISPAFADNNFNKALDDKVSSNIGANFIDQLSNTDKNGNSKSQELNKSGKLRVVIELKKDPIARIADSMEKTVAELSSNQINTYEQRILAEQDTVKEKILSADIKTYDKGDDNKKSDYSYTTVINGFSTYVESKDLEKLENLKEVKNVYIVNEYNKPAEFPNMASSGPQVGADSSWDLGYKGEGMVVAVLDSGYDINHKDFKITDPSKNTLKQSDINSMIKINKLPGKYYTDKFPYAYNYYDKTDKIKSETSNHGQHVAGTIAANGDTNNGGIKGIAPEAQLLGMKVFSDDPLYSTTFSDVYVKAIDDSVKLKADAINMSLGSPAGNYIYGSLEDVAIMNARNAGVLVAIAAGNEHSIVDGIENFMALKATGVPLPYAKNVDNAVVGSPSLYQGDISVASVNNTHIQGRILEYKTKDEQGEMQISVASGSPNPWEVLTETYNGSDIAIINKDNKGDSSKAPGDAASFEAKDVKDKILLIERGNTFTDTIKNAQDRGAKAVIIYNNERPDDTLMSMAGGDTAKIPFLQITRPSGLKIIDNLDDINITFPDELKPFDHPKANEISAFSSFGPTPELGIKPEISAPGGDIYSTDNDDSYVNMSGTSMATPHVAGASALVGQRIKKDSALFGDLSKEERGRLAKILLLNTAKPILDPNGEYYLVRQQGSGLMDINGATTTDSYVVEKSSGEAKAEIGSFEDKKITINLTVYNKSKQNRRFNVHANALTDKTTEVEGYEYLTESARNIEGINVSGGGDIIVPKLGKKDVRITIDLSEAIANGELAEQNFVEGFVFFDSKDNKVDLSLPYLGFYGNYEELNVLDEPITNLYDNDKSNDPMFTATKLYYQEDGKTTAPVSSHTPLYINSKEKGNGNSGLILSTTPLRNFDRIEYSIEDKDGNTLENLGKTEGGRKITNMGLGQAPYKFFAEGIWDGTINGQPLEEGRSVYYTAKAFYSETSKPQVIRFEVKADNKFPEVSDYKGKFKTKGKLLSDIKLAYDPDTKVISFKARDDKSGSGIGSISLIDIATISSDEPDFVSWNTEEKLKEIRKSGDKFDGEYEINIPEDGFKNNILVVYVEDKAGNSVIGKVITGSLGDEKEKEDFEDDDENIELEDGELKAPVIDDGVILPGQVRLYGNAFVANADVVLERDSKDKDNTEADRVEFARVKSNNKGEFIVNPLALQRNGLGLGDKIYIHSEKDDKKSPETVIVIGEDPNLSKPSDKLTMYIKSPGLLEAYSSDVAFDITMFGWYNLDRISFNGVDLPFTVNDYQKVNHPETGEQVHYGKTYNVRSKLDLAEGYYDIPIIAYDDKNDRQFALTRRFWVDKTKPELELVSSGISEDVTDKRGNRSFTVRTSDNEVNVNFLIKDNGPEVSLFRGETQLYTDGVTDSSGFAFKGIESSVNEVIKLGNKKEVTHEYIARDIADNASKITVKVIKEEQEQTAKENSPVIKAADRTVYVGETLNLLYQVSAKDYEGNDLTKKVSSNPKSIDTSKPGEYKVKYEVIDSDGNYGTKTVTVKVIARKDDVIDKSELIEKIEEAKKYQAENYSLTIYQRLQETIKKAEYNLKSVSLTEKLVSKLIAELDNAINDLVDISELNKAYELANNEALYGKEDYTEESYNSLNESIKEAKEVLAKEKPSQEEVDLALKNLNEAIKNLVRITDKKELTSLYNKLVASLENDEINTNKYSEDSVKALIDALDKAKAILDNTQASQQEIDDAYNNLITAHKNLEEKEIEVSVNKEKLSLLYEQANSVILDELTPKSSKNLKDALDKAYEVLNNQKASQEDADKAYEQLEKALNEMKLKANKDSLKALVDEYDDLDKDRYTKDSYEEFEQALAKAKEVLEDAEVSQEEVDKAAKNLMDSYEKLEERTVELRKELADLLAKAEVEVKKSGYSRQNVIRLKLRISSAKRVLAKEDPSYEELTKQIKDLKFALDNLK